MSTWRRGLLSVFMLTSSFASAEARDISFSLGHPPGSIFARGAETFARTLEEETGGLVKARIFPMSLLTMAETSAGIRDGLADMGAVMVTYHPAEYPHTNFILDSSLLIGAAPGDTPVGAAYAAAVTEFIHTRCPECISEFLRQNQVFLGGAGSSRYALNCSKPISSAAEIGGARLRVGGASWARWAGAVGASPVTMAGDETLQALSQGLIDCVVLSIPDIQTFGLVSAVKHITRDVPGGVYVASFANVNRDRWLAFTPQEKAAMVKGVARGAAATSWAYHQDEQRVLDRFRQNGGQVYHSDQALLDLTENFMEEDLAALASIYEGRGVTRAAEMQKDFREIIERWLVLTGGLTSEEELADLYMLELFSKLDLTDALPSVNAQ